MNNKLLHVADRDNDRCWLCGKHVDLNLPSEDPDGPTLDHIVPRARGGKGNERNLRLAHRRCNNARGHSPHPAERAVRRRAEEAERKQQLRVEANRSVYARPRLVGFPHEPA